MNIHSRTSALGRTLAAFQALVLMGALVLSSSPFMAYAQDAGDTGVSVDTSSTDTADIDTDTDTDTDISDDTTPPADTPTDVPPTDPGTGDDSGSTDDTAKTVTEPAIEAATGPTDDEIRALEEEAEDDFLNQPEVEAGISAMLMQARFWSPPAKPKLVIEKKLVVDGDGEYSPEQFSVTITKHRIILSDQTITKTFDENGIIEVTLDPTISLGPWGHQYYSVEEVAAEGFTTTYEGACDDLEVSHGDEETCTITNDDLTPPAPDQCLIVSDETNFYVEGNDNAVLAWVHAAWADALAGASWIWGSEYVTDPSADETQTFTKSFSVTGTPTAATLTIAVDNGAVVKINGEEVETLDENDQNYDDPAEEIDVLSYLDEGNNTIEITVKNLGYATTDPTVNPAGLIYKLEITDAVCGEPEPEVENSCLVPGESTAPVAFGSETKEANFQAVLDDEGHDVDAFDDQVNIQSWASGDNAVDVTVEFIGKNANLSHVFGYYLNGGTTFTPIFRDGAATGFESTPDQSSGTYSFSVPANAEVVFAIHMPTKNETVYTDRMLNPNDLDQVLVYNPENNHYVLGFEDLSQQGDEDFNDLIVSVHVDGCENVAVCEPGVELLENGNFEAVEVTNGALWDIFNLDTDENLAWAAQWLTSNTSAPKVANIELQETGLNGWSATGEGSQWAELDSDWGGPTDGQTGEEGQVAISQTIATVPGETYTLTFDFSPRPGTADTQNKVEVLANGTVFGTVGPVAASGNQTEWSSYSFSFEATTSETVISFRDAGTPNDSQGTFVDNASLMCQDPEPVATIHVTKIVCEDEADLPNWGAGADDINSETAADFLDTHPTCHLQSGWQFQWTTDSTDPEDNGTEPLGEPWQTFVTGNDGTAEVSVAPGANIRVREVLQDGYLGFTGQNADQAVSAEFYCASDVMHYDNWEWIDSVQENQTYYCVAFNVLEDTGEQCNPDAVEVLLSSDETTYDESGLASVVTFLHDSWVDALDAVWIWKDATTSTDDAANGTTETFTRQFTIDGAPLDASLDLAADNQVLVKVNGTELVNEIDEFNYAATTTYAVPAALLQSGLNTITFTVTNIDHATENTPETNPGGLLYKLTTHDNECAEPTQETVKVYIYKYVDGVQVADDSGLPSFPMTSSWSTTNLGSGSGSYVLGNNEGGTALKYAAVTSAMNVPADYSTAETTGGIVVANAEQCSAGKYYLAGYRTGDSLAEAQAATLSSTAPSFNDLTNDKHVIVENEPCENGGGEEDFGTLTIVKNSVGGNGIFSVTVNPWSEVEDSFPVSLDTVEDGTDSESTQVLTGTYDVSETVPEGWTLQDVSCTNESESSVINGATVTVMADQTTTCTFTNTKNDVPTQTSETVVVTAANPDGWAFNSDRATWTMGTGEYVEGPGSAPLGDGSARLTTPTNDERTKLRKYLPAGTQISNITELRYSTYRAEPTGGALTLALQFDVNFDSSPVDPSKADARLVYEPYHTQQSSILDDAWQEWNALDDAAGTGTGAWWFAGPNASVCPQSNPCTWTELNSAYPDLQISAESLENTIDTEGAMLFKAGGSWAGFDGNVDKFVFGLTTGSNTHTTTYDFEPAEPEPTSRGGGGGSRRAGNNDDGEVLGATTDACVPLIDTYLSITRPNDNADVMDLQNFLNTHMSAGLEVTGIFSVATEAAVHAFQKLYWQDVLAPWFAYPDSGIADADDSTGYVYKTTKWKINNIVCPGSEATPILP